MNSPPRVGGGGVGAIPRPGVGGSLGLPNREGVVTSVDGPPKSGFFAGSMVAFADGVPRENGCIFDKSGFLFCPDVFH